MHPTVSSPSVVFGIGIETNGGPYSSLSGSLSCDVGAGLESDPEEPPSVPGVMAHWDHYQQEEGFVHRPEEGPETNSHLGRLAAAHHHQEEGSVDH